MHQRRADLPIYPRPKGPNKGKLILQYEVTDRSILSCPDNLVMHPGGYSDGRGQLFGRPRGNVSTHPGDAPDGSVYTLARNPQVPPGSEPVPEPSLQGFAFRQTGRSCLPTSNRPSTPPSPLREIGRSQKPGIGYPVARAILYGSREKVPRFCAHRVKGKPATRKATRAAIRAFRLGSPHSKYHQTPPIAANARVEIQPRPRCPPDSSTSLSACELGRPKQILNRVGCPHGNRGSSSP